MGTTCDTGGGDAGGRRSSFSATLLFAAMRMGLWGYLSASARMATFATCRSARADSCLQMRTVHTLRSSEVRDRPAQIAEVSVRPGRAGKRHSQTSRCSRNQDQFLAIGRRSPCIAVNPSDHSASVGGCKGTTGRSHRCRSTAPEIAKARNHTPGKLLQ